MGEYDIVYPEEQKEFWRTKLLRENQTKEENPTKIYLGSPYSHELETVRYRRFIIVSFLAAKFTQMGYSVYSPILAGHTMCQYVEFSYEYSFWKARDIQFLRWCDEFWMVKLDNWGDSTGLASELTQARLLGKQLKGVTISTDLSERAFVLECVFLKANKGFSEKVNLDIDIKEMR